MAPKPKPRAKAKAKASKPVSKSAKPKPATKRTPCEFCGKLYTASGMTRHVASAHRQPPEGWDTGKFPSQRAAVDRVIDHLETMGHIEEIDAARVEACRGLSTVVDEMPFDSGLWGQYQTAVQGLMPDGPSDDKFTDLVAGLQGSL